MLHIRPVRDDADLHRFVTFPRRLYRNDPAWVSPIIAEQKKRLDPDRNPFFKKAERELYLAVQGHDVVGTIAAVDNRSSNEQRGERTGSFGFFESEDDPAIAAALIDTAETWFARRGFDKSIGPMNLSRIEETGVLIEGHDRRPPFLAAHHPPYYQRLVESLGYEKERDALAYEMPLFQDDGSPVVPPQGMIDAVAEVEARSGIVVRLLDWDDWEGEMDKAHHIFVEAFRALEGNYPMSRKEFGNMAGRLRMIMDPRIMLFLERAGEVVGFALLFPEVNEILSHVGGSMFPFGWLKALIWRHRVDTVSFKLFGVLPEYRKEKLAAYLGLQASLAAQKAGYKRLEMSLILESNKRMRGFVELQGATPYLRYRLYRKELS